MSTEDIEPKSCQIALKNLAWTWEQFEEIERSLFTLGDKYPDLSELEQFKFTDHMLDLVGLQSDQTLDDPDGFCRDYWYDRIDEINDIEDRTERMCERLKFLIETKDYASTPQRHRLTDRQSEQEAARLVHEVFAHNDGIPT